MIHPVVSLSLASKKNAPAAGGLPSSACVAHASKYLYDSTRLCHYYFCSKGALEFKKKRKFLVVTSHQSSGGSYSFFFVYHHICTSWTNTVTTEYDFITSQRPCVIAEFILLSACSLMQQDKEWTSFSFSWMQIRTNTVAEQTNSRRRERIVGLQWKQVGAEVKRPVDVGADCWTPTVKLHTAGTEHTFAQL